MTPGTVRVRVYVTVETIGGRASDWSSATQTITHPPESLLRELQTFAGGEARSRTWQLWHRLVKK